LVAAFESQSVVRLFPPSGKGVVMPATQEALPGSRSGLSRSIIFSFSFSLGMAVLLASLALGSIAGAQTATVLHTFSGNPGDGYNPAAPVIVAPDGTLYGTTFSGGDYSCTMTFGGCGTVFQETRSGGQWKYTTIHEFDGTDGVVDGCCQVSTLTRDQKGRLYGVTIGGSFGKVFRMAPGGAGKPWHFDILYTFQNLSDGHFPLTPLFIDDAGAIYGITQSGSLTTCPNGCGAVFQIVPPKTAGGTWTENTLYQFTGGSDGGIPDTMIMDSKGVIYGTTNYAGIVNGSCPSGCGTVFRLARQNGSWNFSVIFTFDGHPDGNAYDSLFEDARGALYGLAFQINVGQEIFKLTPPKDAGVSWRRRIVYSFNNGISYLTAGPKGVLYGVETGDQDINAGSLFKLTPRTGGGYSLRTLVDFNNGPDRNPNAVTVGGSGVLYGTLSGGSSDGGMVISVK
jgi:hypothetical protein